MSDSVEFSGPLFDGRMPAILSRYESAASQRLAQRGHDAVEQILGSSLQHPTGYYQSHVRVERQADDSVVTDDGVVYGPWLEGTGSRNETTRFKGYHSFRQAAQRVNEQAVRIAESVLHEGYLAEMNGE